VKSFCELGNESTSTKGGEFIHLLRKYLLLKKGFPVWSYLVGLFVGWLVGWLVG
jgi:hypothetical protein